MKRMLPKPRESAGRVPRRFTLEVSAGQSGPEYWRAKAGSLHLESSHAEPTWTQGDLISFTTAELSLKLGGKDSLRYLRRLAMSQLGTTAVGALQGKEHGWYYVTSEGRATAPDNPGVIYSGLALLREAVHQAQTQHALSLNEPCLLGVVFPGDVVTAVVLARREPDGSIGNVQYVPVADGAVESAMAGYIQSSQLEQSGVLPESRQMVFDATQLLELLARITPYPRERMVAGLNQSSWNRLVRLGAAGAAAATCAWAAGLQYQIWSDQRATLVARQDAATVAAESQQLAHERFSSLMKGTSVDVQRAVQVATQAHVEGSRVELNANRTAATVLITLTAATPYEAQLLAATRQPAKECARPALSLGKGMVETYVQYECEVPHNRLGADLGSRQ